MKFKKLAAGIMSAVMLATSVLAVDAGATLGSLVFEGDKEISFSDGMWDAGAISAGNSGTIEIELKVKGSSDSEIWTGLQKDDSFPLNTGAIKCSKIVVDGKEYNNIDPVNKAEEEKFANGEDYKVEEIKSGAVNIDYGIKNGAKYLCLITLSDTKEHTVKITYTGLEKKQYEVKITANSATGTIKAYAGKSSSSAASTSAPAKTKLSASAKKNKLTLTWDKVSDAEKYQVYVSTDGGKTYSRYKTYKATATKATYTLTKGNTYKFKVRSYKTVDGKKVYSKWSNVKTVKY